MRARKFKVIECTRAPATSTFFTKGRYYVITKVGKNLCNTTDDESGNHSWDTHVLENTKAYNHSTQFKSVN